MATSDPMAFQAGSSIKRTAVFMFIGWILPAIGVGISTGLGIYFEVHMETSAYYKNCHNHVNISSPKYDRCWLAPGTPNFYASIITPLALLLLINLVIALKTSVVTLNSRRMRNRGEDPGKKDVVRAVKSLVLLTFMLGGTWGLAFFTGKQSIARRILSFK